MCIRDSCCIEHDLDIGSFHHSPLKLVFSRESVAAVDQIYGFAQQGKIQGFLQRVAAAAHYGHGFVFMEGAVACGAVGPVSYTHLDVYKRKEQSYDLEEIWNAVFREGEAAKGSFYIIGSGGRLTEIGETDFTVKVSSELVKKHAENNRSLLEDLMEKHTGSRRMMKLVLEGGNMPGKEKTVEEIAREAEDVLGVNIEIE